MRSKLFVPGSRPLWFAKSLAGPADALSFDLEDSVAESAKASARAELGAFLQGDLARQARKLIIVRVNALHSQHIENDLQAVARAPVAIINVPKVESAADVQQAAAALAAAEALHGLAPGIGLLLNIETPKGLRLAAEIAAAHPRVVGLQLGLADLFEPLGMQRRDPALVQAAQWAVRLAAAEAGVLACDAAFADLSDPAGFEAEARMAQRMGFVGKSCIHPSQVLLANQVFQPTPGDIAHAQAVVRQVGDAAAQRQGVAVVQGQMIDAPFVRRAHDVLNLADRLGLLTSAAEGR